MSETFPLGLEFQFGTSSLNMLYDVYCFVFCTRACPAAFCLCTLPLITVALYCTFVNIFIGNRISVWLWMRDLFSQCTCICTYIRVCHAQECQFVLTSLQRNSCVTCTTHEGTGCLVNHGGQTRTVLLDNGGLVGQHGWSSTTCMFFRVKYWMQPKRYGESSQARNKLCSLFMFNWNVIVVELWIISDICFTWPTCMHSVHIHTDMVWREASCASVVLVRI